MSFEDGAVLGECLKGIDKTTPLEGKIKALTVYESCRIKRTNAIVARGNLQQDLNHLDDGPDQIERDRKMRAFGEMERSGVTQVDWSAYPGLTPGEDPLVWRRFGAGGWLLSYRPEEDVRARWGQQTRNGMEKM
jgi:salicylate hydroxylase